MVDQGSGHRLEAASCLLLGRIALDLEQQKNAVRWLNRAVGAALDGEIRTVAVLTLACAYLIAEQPENTRG